MSGRSPVGPHLPRFSVVLGCLVACAALATARQARAGASEPPAGRFQRFTTADGLGDPRVRSVLQDHLGFLWVATVDGLDRFDGLRFRSFRHDSKDSGSLPQGIPNVLLEDRRGRLWIGLLGGGLSRFDPGTERFRSFIHNPSDPHSLSGDDVTDLLEGLDGEVWIATHNGLNRLDPDSETLTRFTHDPRDKASLSGNDVSSLGQDRTGAVWIGTGDGGINRMTVDRPSGSARFLSFRHNPGDPRSLGSDNVSSILVDRQGRLWVGTWDAGLYRYDPDGGGFVRPRPGPAEPSTWKGDRISRLLEDHDGMLWVATWGAGLIRFDPATSQLTRYEPDPANPTGLGHANVAALCEDRSGLLWIATTGGGLNALDLKPKAFRRLTLKGAGPRGADVPDVRALVEDAEGSLWAGTAGTGLLKVDRSGRVLERHRHDPANPDSLADDNVWALLEDRQGTLWVGTFGGLDRFDRVRRRFVHHRHDPRDTESLSDDLVYSIFEDSMGRLLVGTWNGLNVLDRATGRFVRSHQARRGTEGEQPDSVLAIAEDSAGSIWVALRGELARFAADQRTLNPVPLLLDGREDEGVVWCLTNAAFGGLWVGKGTGVLELRASAGDGPPSIRRHALPAGGGVVASIESDQEGRLWLGTNRGLVRYDPASGESRRYDTDDGTLGEGFNPGASFRSSRGRLSFGTTSGITSFEPAEIRDDVTAPPVVLTGLRLGPRQMLAGSPVLPRAMSETSEIRVPYVERVLTVEFAALGFRAPRKNRFRYRLDGYDTEWNELLGDRKEATYVNLSPGRYLLHVTAANSDGVWNEKGTSLVVEVLPPFWGTWWFRMLALGGVVIAFLVAHRALTGALHARSRRLENELRERRLAQEALARSEQQLRLIADALPVLIAYVDESRRCVFSNLASERWFGRPRAELAGKRIDEVLPRDLLPVVEGPVVRALAGEGCSFEMQSGPPEKPRHIAATLVPRAEGDGSFRGFYALAQDITTRARTEEALRRQQEELAHASRVLTLGELAAAIAHELNQPLTAILLNAQAALLLHGQPDSKGSDVDDALRDISADATRGGEIIRRLRDLVRRGHARREPLDLNLAIRAVEPLLRAGALEGGAVVELDLAPGLSEAHGDAIQIQQVVLNLVRNAVEAMRAVPQAERRLRLSTGREGDAIVVEVTDNGPPLDAGAFEGLFVPFLSTKRSGLGMGLSLSRSIVEGHGGRIEGHRNPGRGLTVRFTLPVPVPERIEA